VFDVAFPLFSRNRPLHFLAMRILKIFGIVVGIHVMAVMLIFPNPGCSTQTRPTPVPADTVAKSSPPIAGGLPAGAVTEVTPTPAAPAPVSGDAPAIRFNPTRPNTPVAGALVATPVEDVTPAKSYTVGNGDNLWTLAKKHNVSVGDLAAANNLKVTSVLHPGQKLIIPGKSLTSKTAEAAPKAESAAVGAVAPAAGKASSASPAASSAAKPTAAGASKHLVKSGESLSVIARQYGVRQAELMQANNITDPKKIRAGMELVIPASAGAAKAAPAKATEPAKKPVQVPTLNLDLSAPAPVAPKPDDSPFSPAPKN
jgi:LysM repeat protein